MPLSVAGCDKTACQTENCFQHYETLVNKEHGFLLNIDCKGL